MNRSTPGITPLRQRMLEDMHLRKLEPKTQTCYVRAVRRLAEFLQRSPDTATAEDLRLFQLHLVDHGTSPITLNATLTGLKFFFGVTVGREEVMAKTSSVRVPQTLPVVLRYRTTLNTTGRSRPAAFGAPGWDSKRLGRFTLACS